MAVTIENCQAVENAAGVLRSCVQRRNVALVGTFTYQNPVSGESATAVVSAQEKTNINNAYKAALAALKAAVQALSE